ncbi:MAG TPA: Xaa-Pro dipeptidyl-peptidase [Jiangellales bacterium]|nr:Xaa-Pro dipeptidyl-peptidase [Jiangellales bacterium]
MRTLPRVLIGALAGCTAAAVAVPVGAANAQQTGTAPPIVVENGLTQPVYAFTQAIEQRLWVETPLDTDGNGVLDRVVIDVSRPAETATADLKVPVILEVSPYRSGTWGSVPYHADIDPEELPQASFVHQADRMAGARPAPDLPGALDNYYVPRGYGVVVAQSVGTAQSDGCPTTGDDAETQSAKAIVDWLGGRARAFDASGAEVAADWTTGAVGMTGASYNGTIPNQLATLGREVPNLRTIVPIVAISDWYGYYRENGLVVAPGGYQGEDADILARYVGGMARSLAAGSGANQCLEEMAAIEAAQDRVTGDYNAFWDDRNYLPGATRVQASVFVVDGRNDWNVKPLQWSRWWDELSRQDVPRKIWLHNGGHGTPGNNAAYTLPSGQSWTYQTTVHRWFDHWLWGVDNGIMTEPRAIVQREGTNANQLFGDWPVPGSQDVTLRLAAADAAAPGTLAPLTAAPGRSVAQSFVDNGRNRAATNLLAGPDTADPNRLVYLSDVLASPMHLSGTPSVRIRASVDNAAAANLTAYLVDYGPPGSTSATMVTRGWIDVQNRVRRDKTDPIQQGKSYDFHWDLHADDYVFQTGRRIGVVVMSTDRDFTLRPLPGTQLTVEPGFSSVTLPVVGGSKAFPR